MTDQRSATRSNESLTGEVNPNIQRSDAAQSKAVESEAAAAEAVKKAEGDKAKAAKSEAAAAEAVKKAAGDKAKAEAAATEALRYEYAIWMEERAAMRLPLQRL